MISNFDLLSQGDTTGEEKLSNPYNLYWKVGGKNRKLIMEGSWYYFRKAIRLKNYFTLLNKFYSVKERL